MFSLFGPAAGGVRAREAEPELAFQRQWTEQVFAGPGLAAAVPPGLSIVREGAAGDTKLNRGTAGGPLRLGNQSYARGIGVNSHSILRATLGQPAARFVATIGLDRNVDNTPASVRFHVAVHGKDVWTSNVLRPTGAVEKIDVPLAGATRVDLIVDDGGDGRAFDQAIWADARFVLEDGRELWLDELAQRPRIDTALPFSFVYGGRPSSELVGQWKQTVEEQAVDATERRRIVTLSDPETGLEVRAVARVYLDTPGVDWTLYFTNRGSQETPALEQLRAVDVRVPSGLGAPSAVLHRLRADHENWLPLDTPLSPGQRIEFAPSAGRSSLGVSPFFNLSWGDAGVITAIGWTGQWTAAVEQAPDGLHLAAGMQNLHLRLRPGETIRSPRILQLYWFGEAKYRPYNLFRQTMFRHVVPKIDGKTVMPPIAHLSTAFYEMDRGTQADVLSHLTAIRGLGFEHFWLDAYYGKDDFPTVGNYVLPLLRGFNQTRFPQGLRPIGEAVHREGLQFLLWFEPERICPGTLLAQEHPEWVVLPKDGGWGMFNLGIPAAREYLTDYLNRSIREYGVNCLRIDNAVSYNGLWEQADQATPERRGLSEIRYVEGLYRLWDDLLAAHPGLFIDNCASGGARIDLETCARSLPLWRTDGTIGPLLEKNFDQAALQNQAMTASLSRYVPLSTSGQMGAQPYQFRSGVNGGGIAFAEDVRPADYPRELLRQAIAEAKRLRKYYLGNYYPLTDATVDPRDWCVIQYDRPSEHDGMFVLFRRNQSRFASYELRDAQKIEADAEYEVVHSAGYQPSTPTRMKGSALQRLKITIDDCPGSTVVEYRRVHP